MKNPKGRLELTWMGKNLALIPSEQGKYDYEWVNPTDPRAAEVKSIQVTGTVGERPDENLLIVGDSGDALRALTRLPEWADKYRGKVKLVYIDPPFNTGQAFDHYADALEHSVWLTFMRDRLRDVKSLLSSDGSIWVHLDDAEVHRMRSLLDEELGVENFAGTIIWQKAYSPRNDATGFSTDQDYILVYGRQPGWKVNRLPRLASRDALYKSDDGDPRPWVSGDPAAPGARTHQGMVYGIQSPFTGEFVYPAIGRCWSGSQTTMLDLIQQWGVEYELADIGDEERRAQICDMEPGTVRQGVQALVVKGDVGAAKETAKKRYEAGSWPRLYFTRGGDGGLKLKRYLDDISQDRAPQTIWFHDEVGHNREAKAEIKALFPNKNPFATPKPERLLERVLTLGTQPGEVVLDFFGGSGTTAAVAHKMGRRWVTVELQASTVAAFTRPRLEKVAAGTDTGGISSCRERQAAADLPDGVSPEDAQAFTALLSKFATADGVSPEAVRALKNAARTRTKTTVNWSGGGGFTTAVMSPSMYDVDDEDGTVYLSEAAVNGAFSRAMVGQLGFRFETGDPVFCGRKGRTRLAVIDGVADEHVVRTVAASLGTGEKAVVVAKGILENASAMLRELSPGSRIRKAPDDLFTKGTVK